MKKSFLVLAAFLAVPALLGSCSKKPASSETPASSSEVPQQDPHQVLAGWEDAEDMALNTSIAEFSFTEIGEMKKFKLHFQEGDGFHYFKLMLSGSNISADAIEQKVLDYKGDALPCEYGSWLNTYDGYMYISVKKIGEGSGGGHPVSTYSTFKVQVADYDVTFGEDNYYTFSPVYNITTSNPLWLRCNIPSAQRCSWSLSGGTGLSSIGYELFNKNGEALEFNNDWDGSTAKFKYNFQADTAGYYFLKASKVGSDSISVGTAKICAWVAA